MSSADRLAPIMEKLSELLAVDDGLQLLEHNEALIESVHTMLLIIDDIDISQLTDLDVDQVINPSFTILSMIAELGQQHDDFATLPAMIWKVYVKLMRRFGKILHSDIIGKFLEILVSSCEEGLGVMQSSVNNAVEAITNEHLRLLTFFIQRLTATLVNCQSYFDEHSDMLTTVLLVLFAFFGMLHSCIGDRDLHPSQPALSYLFQALMKVFTSGSNATTAAALATQISQNRSVDILDSQTEIKSDHVLRMDVLSLVTLHDTLEYHTCNTSDDHNSYASYTPIAQKHCYFIREGMIKFMLRSLSLLAVRDKEWKGMENVQCICECGQFVNCSVRCLVSILAHQIQSHSSLLRDKGYLEVICSITNSVSDLMTQHPLFLGIWDLMLLHSFGLEDNKATLFKQDHGQLDKEIFIQLVANISKSFSEDDQLDLVKRALSILTLALPRPHSKTNFENIAATIIAMVISLPVEQQRLVLPDVFKIVTAFETVGPALLVMMLSSGQEVIREERIVMKFIREQLQGLNQAAADGIAMHESSGCCVQSVAAFISACKKNNVLSAHMQSLLSQFIDNKVIGSFVIRMLSATCRHLETRLSPLTVKNISESYRRKLLAMVQSVDILTKLLSMHQIPKGVRVILIDNASKLSSVALITVEHNNQDPKHNGSWSNEFVLAVVQSWFAMTRLIVATQGERLQCEDLQSSFANIVKVWNLVKTDPFWHWHISVMLLSETVQLVKVCSDVNKEALTSMLKNSFGVVAKSFSRKLPTAFEGRGTVALTEDRLKIVSKFVLRSKIIALLDPLSAWANLRRTEFEFDNERSSIKRRKLNDDSTLESFITGQSK